MNLKDCWIGFGFWQILWDETEQSNKVNYWADIEIDLGFHF